MTTNTAPVGSPYAAIAGALDHAHRMSLDYLTSLPERPVGRRVTPEDLAALDEPLPEHGCAVEAVLDEWLARAEPGIVASPGPRFFGFVNGGSTPAALAGDWLASALDQNAGPWLSSPAAAQTELTVLGWLAELFGLPREWSGGLTSGTTQANLTGLAAGRQWVGQRLGFDPARDGLGGHPPIPVISSTEIHASARKALGTLGLGRASVRTVPAPGGAVDLSGLAAALAETDGPAIVVANAGEVNSGAFDDLAGVAAICRRHTPGVWLHVDGAFGLFAALSPSVRHLTRGVKAADSVAVDLHKWLNVPYDSGAAFVRDADALRAAFAATAAYLAPEPGAGRDPMSHVPEMSRRFRALAVWCTLKAYGRAGYQALVERCVANAADFAAWIDAEPGLELMAPAPLNIVCFRYAPPGLDGDAADTFNRQAVAALQADGRVFVTGTVWNGRAAIRAAFDNWATGPEDVAILKDALTAVATGS
jgi:glutamate/tyrosine decarboxylase-like PLP-dependent enzyme